MHGLFVALALVAGGPVGPNPAALVEALGSPRYLERESAEQALTRMGREALPCLRAAADARDPEVRIRSLAILNRIEGALLVQPTPIALDFRDVPIAEAVRTINRRAGLSLKLTPEDDASWAGSRLTLVSDQPLPFWKGVDALCRAGRLHYQFGASTAGRRDTSFAISDVYAPPPDPVWDSGPFRTHLASVHYQSEIQLSKTRGMSAPKGERPGTLDEGAAGASVATRQFYLEFQLAAEPRLSVTRNGSPRIVEATDDLDKSLLMPSAPATNQRHSGYFGLNPSSLVRFRVDLAYPESSNRRIKRIKGFMPVIVATRKPDPLKIPIEGSIGRSFRNVDVELAIREMRPARDGQPAAIELTLKIPNGAIVQGTDEVDPVASRLESPQDQLEILDAVGQPLAWFPSSSYFNGEETRLTVTLTPQGTSLPRPATVAYHGMTRLATEVPFEFRDVPIP